MLLLKYICYVSRLVLNLDDPGMSTPTQQLHWHIVCRCITAITLIDYQHTGPFIAPASSGNCKYRQ